MDKKPSTEPDPSILLKHLPVLVPQKPAKKDQVYTVQPLKKTLFARRP
jgi:hypothetical protein